MRILSLMVQGNTPQTGQASTASIVIGLCLSRRRFVNNGRLHIAAHGETQLENPSGVRTGDVDRCLGHVQHMRAIARGAYEANLHRRDVLKHGDTPTDSNPWVSRSRKQRATGF